jgi:hypothetical protein
MHRLGCFKDACRVREGVVAHMRESHVAYAERVVLSQDRKRVAKLVCTAAQPGRSQRNAREGEQKGPTHPSTPMRDATFLCAAANLTSIALLAGKNVCTPGTLSAQISVHLIARASYLRILCHKLLCNVDLLERVPNRIVRLEEVFS